MSQIGSSNVPIANNAIVLGPYDVDKSSAYGFTSTQLTAQIDSLGGGLTSEQSNDGVTWYALQSFTTTGITSVNVGSRFVRIRATGAGTPIISIRLGSSALPVAASGGGSGGGPATIANGADVAEGSTTDSAAADGSSTSTVISLLKGMFNRLLAVLSVQGSVATGSAVTGNAVRAGARVANSGIVSTDGNLADLIVDSRNNLRVALSSNTGSTPGCFAPNSATVSPNNPGLFVISASTVFDGTNFTRQPGNSVGTFMIEPPADPVNRSATLSTTASTLMAANTTRAKLIIKNDSTVDIWINYNGTAAATAGAGNIKIAAGAYYSERGIRSAVSAIATSGTPAITALEL